MSKKGKIYKIISRQGNDVYIGSTFSTIRDRFFNHRACYKIWKNTEERRMSVFDLFEKYGIENCKIILIKEYEVVDKRHLEMYETLWINKFKQNCINTNSPFCIMKLYKKQWHQENKYKYDHEYNHEKYIRNKDNLLKYQKERRNIIEQSKKCDCGSDYTISNKARHTKSKKHQKWLIHN